MGVFDREVHLAGKPQGEDSQPLIIKLFGFRGHDFFGRNQSDNIGVLSAAIPSCLLFLRWNMKECFPLDLPL